MAAKTMALQGKISYKRLPLQSFSRVYAPGQTHAFHATDTRTHAPCTWGPRDSYGTVPWHRHTGAFTVLMCCARFHTGPFFPEGSEQVGYNLQAAFTYPVFLPITNANETWGYGREVSGCPPGLCYNPMTKMKL